MLLIIAVLAVFIADICCENPTLLNYNGTDDIRQEVDCKAFKTTILTCVPEMKSTFEWINENWIVNPRWDDKIAVEALKEASKQNTAQADYKILRIERFDKGSRNETSMAEKVEITLALVCPFWLEKKSTLLTCLLRKESQLRQRHIPSSSYYGCNGIFDTTGKQYDVLTVSCLYYKGKWNSGEKRNYKNFEI